MMSAEVNAGMDDTRKRYLAAGVIVGTVAVGLAVLYRRTPKDRWNETLNRIAHDAVGLLKSRYGGGSTPVLLAERALERWNASTPDAGSIESGDASGDAIAGSTA